MKHILIIYFLISSAMVFAGAEGKIEFGKTNHYFGTFPKSKGKVSYSFEFTNSTKKPVVITNVKSSCGCTATDYTRQPVMPGEKGHVNVRFDPSRFSGYFSKKITVYNNASTQPDYLTISGRIRVNHKVSDAFKYFIGDLKADTKTIHFGDAQKSNQELSREIKLINIMRDSVKAEIIDRPDWLSLCMLTKSGLTQGDNTRILTKVKTKDLHRWGALGGTISLKLERGVKSEVKKIPVGINIIDAFPAAGSRQEAQQPRITAVTDTLHINSKSNKMSMQKLVLLNTGQSTLLIRNVQSSSKEVIIKKFDSSVEPGKKGKVYVQCKSGHVPFDVLVWCNDPEQYKLVIPAL